MIRFRQFTAITLLVSMVAMATSGLMMFVIERPSFAIQMHPVHKLFGLLLIASAAAHVILNRRALLGHVKQRSGTIASGVLAAALVALYGVAVAPSKDEELAWRLDKLGTEYGQSAPGN